eukprot:gene8934-2945_t
MAKRPIDRSSSAEPRRKARKTVLNIDVVHTEGDEWLTQLLKDDKVRAIGGECPLAWACTNEEMTVVDAMYRRLHKAMTRARVLRAACESNNVQLLRNILDVESDMGCPLKPLVSNHVSSTLVHTAYEQNNVEMLDVLLSYGWHCDAKGEDHSELSAGLSVLQRAAGDCNVQMARCLLRHGSNPHILDEDHLSLVQRAIETGDGDVEQHLEIMSILLDAGVDVDHTDGDGFSTLHTTAFYGNNQELELQLLLSHNPNVNGDQGVAFLTPLEAVNEVPSALGTGMKKCIVGVIWVFAVFAIILSAMLVHNPGSTTNIDLTQAPSKIQI